jgi:hypothetical protein
MFCDLRLVNLRSVTSRIYGPNRFSIWKLPCNKHLINLVCSVRTISCGSSFFPLLYDARTMRLSHNTVGKTRFHNLRYGPRTRLIRGIYIDFNTHRHIATVWDTLPEISRRCVRGVQYFTHSPRTPRARVFRDTS